METKFKSKQTVNFKGKECMVICAKKNFSNNRITYRLSSNELVEEDELWKHNKPSLLAEPVAEPVAETAEETAEETEEETEETEGYKTLKALTQVQLQIFIRRKKLDIDPKDYKGKDDLLIAVCQELNVPIP